MGYMDIIRDLELRGRIAPVDLAGSLSKKAEGASGVGLRNTKKVPPAAPSPVEAPPVPPASGSPPVLPSGWTVAYRDSGGTIRDGTVAEHVGGQVRLVSGATIPARSIVGVSDGCGAWLVREHGLIPADRRYKPDWLAAAWSAAWKGLATVTDGIPCDDPRFPAVMAALDLCDLAFMAGDWRGFGQAAEQVRRAARGQQ